MRRALASSRRMAERRTVSFTTARSRAAASRRSPRAKRWSLTSFRARKGRRPRTLPRRSRRKPAQFRRTKRWGSLAPSAFSFRAFRWPAPPARLNGMSKVGHPSLDLELERRDVDPQLNPFAQPQWPVLYRQEVARQERGTFNWNVQDR